MVVGRGWQRGALGPPDFETISKKVFFSISRGKNQISPLLAFPGKKFGKISYWPPWKKILPTPMPAWCSNFSKLCESRVNIGL